MPDRIHQDIVALERSGLPEDQIFDKLHDSYKNSLAGNGPPLDNSYTEAFRDTPSMVAFKDKLKAGLPALKAHRAQMDYEAQQFKQERADSDWNENPWVRGGKRVASIAAKGVPAVLGSTSPQGAALVGGLSLLPDILGMLGGKDPQDFASSGVEALTGGLAGKLRSAGALTGLGQATGFGGAMARTGAAGLEGAALAAAPGMIDDKGNLSAPEPLAALTGLGTGIAGQTALSLFGKRGANTGAKVAGDISRKYGGSLDAAQDEVGKVFDAKSVNLREALARARGSESEIQKYGDNVLFPTRTPGGQFQGTPVTEARKTLKATMGELKTKYGFKTLAEIPEDELLAISKAEGSTKYTSKLFDEIFETTITSGKQVPLDDAMKAAGKYVRVSKALTGSDEAAKKNLLGYLSRVFAGKGAEGASPVGLPDKVKNVSDQMMRELFPSLGPQGAKQAVDEVMAFGQAADKMRLINKTVKDVFVSSRTAGSLGIAFKDSLWHVTAEAMAEAIDAGKLPLLAKASTMMKNAQPWLESLGKDKLSRGEAVRVLEQSMGEIFRSLGFKNTDLTKVPEGQMNVGR